MGDQGYSHRLINSRQFYSRFALLSPLNCHKRVRNAPNFENPFGRLVKVVCPRMVPELMMLDKPPRIHY